jgi:phosphate transport system protein
MDSKQVLGEVEELERQVVAMGSMVESLFAEAAMALIEGSPGMVPDLREEDCRAHERWLEIDKLCTELLTNGELDPDQVHFVWAADKIATDLKRAADGALRVGASIRSCDPGSLPTAESLAGIPQMAELTQSMLSDVIEAFINHDAAEAGGLHLVFRELASLNGRTREELASAMSDGKLPVPLGLSLVCLAQQFEEIGNEVLDISNQVRQLHRLNNSQ